MKKILRLFLFITLTVLFTISDCVKAQSLEETLSSLSSSVGKAYVAPVISAFGSNLNSGWVSKLPAPTKLGLHLDLKIIGMGSFFSDENKTFKADGDFYFTSDQVDLILQNSDITPGTVGSTNYNNLRSDIVHTKFNVGFSGPTIVGKEDQYLKVNFPGRKIISGGQEYDVDSYALTLDQVKGFLKDIPILPSGALQITGGTVAGTNVSFRFLPSVQIEDLGKFSFWGLGAIHNPGVWFKNPLPLDLGVGYFYQQLTVGDVFETKATQFGIYAGKTFGVIVAIAPYIGLTVESSKTTVKYDYQSNEMINGVPVPPVKVNFELEGENGTGFLLGFNLKLSAFNINADYKIAKYKTISGGISLGF